MGLINAIKTLDNINHSFSLPYGYCETAAGTTAKKVTVPNVSELTEGLAIIVRFKNSNSASSPTLNVNGLGAKNIYRYGTTKASTSTTVSGWIAGAVQLFVYNGTGWVRDYWSNTTYTNEGLGQGYYTCDTAANTVAKVTSADTDSKYTLVDNGIVSVKFTNGSAQASTLNINSKGAIPIVGDMTDIQTNEICTFIYDGANYHLVARNDLKNALLNGAGEAYDTLKELGDLIDENTDAIDALEEIAINKMDKNDPTGSGTFSMNKSKATGTGAFAIGNGTTVVASGDYSFASGCGGDPAHKLEASGIGSHAEGSSTKATGDYSHAEGSDTKAIGTSSHAEGYMTEASEAYAHVEGERTFALNRGAHAEGQSTSATGLASHAEGVGTEASGHYSHAEGVYANAIGTGSHAEGGSGAPQPGGQAYGDCSHAEGYSTFAIGVGSHAEGKNSLGYGDQISLTGEVNTTTYTYDYSGRDYLVFLKVGNICYYNGYTSRIIEYNASNSTVTFEHTLNPSEEFNNTTVKIFTAGSFGSCSHSEGENTIASGDSSHAEGYYAGAIGNDAHAEGYCTQAKGIGSHAEGCKTQATGHYSHVEGGTAGGDTMSNNGSKATGLNSHAEGSSTQASAEGAHAEGYKTIAGTTATHAEGYQTIASGLYAHAEGGSYYGGDSKYGDAGYSGSRTITIAEGGPAYQKTIYGPYAAGNNSHAEGGLTYAKSVASHAEGSITSALGQASHAEGLRTIADGIGAHAEGENAIASGTSSHAEGYRSAAVGYCSHAEGIGTLAVGPYSHAEGYRVYYSSTGMTTIIGTSLGDVDENGYYTLEVEDSAGLSVGMYVSTGFPKWEGKEAEENTTSIYTKQANHIDNYAKIVEIDFSNNLIKINRELFIYPPTTSDQLSTSQLFPFYGGAYGAQSHTSGENCFALGENSYAEGYYTVADGENSHAEGYRAHAEGESSHAEGWNTKASGVYSHAEGDRTKATGRCSHAEGFYTIAAGKYSHVNGCETKALSDYQTVIGKYNRQDASNKYAFIIGNGTFENSVMDRSNAFTVDWGGNGVFTGGITATNFNGYTIEKSVPSDAKFTDTTYSAATTSANGLMTSAMVTKLNGITAGAQPNVVTAVETAGAGSGGKAVITMADGTKWYFPTLVAGSGTIATTWLPTATSSASGIVKVGSNITVSSGTISLTKSNVTSALGYTPTKKEFIFDTYSKSVTINPGDQSVTVGALTQRSGYTLLGYINQNGGYTDQWLISYGTYGSNVVAMVHSKYSGTLTQTISCTAIWYKNQ